MMIQFTKSINIAHGGEQSDAMPKEKSERMWHFPYFWIFMDSSSSDMDFYGKRVSTSQLTRPFNYPTWMFQSLT